MLFFKNLNLWTGRKKEKKLILNVYLIHLLKKYR